MELDLKWLLTTLGVIVGIVATKIFERWFLKQEMGENEIAKLTLAIQALQLRIEFLTEKLAPMPKIQSDINELHSKVREINARTNS